MSSMATEKRNMAQEQADAYAETLEEIWAAIDADEEYEDQDPREYLDEMPLEIVWQAGSPFEILFGVGGPSTWIEQDARYDNPELISVWGGDRGVVRSEAIRRTADYFRELVDQS